jgi:hypothetical protein
MIRQPALRSRPGRQPVAASPFGLLFKNHSRTTLDQLRDGADYGVFSFWHGKIKNTASGRELVDGCARYVNKKDRGIYTLCGFGGRS